MLELVFMFPYHTTIAAWTTAWGVSSLLPIGLEVEVIASWGYAIHAIMPLVALKLGHGLTCLEGFPILVVPLSSTFIHECLKIELL